MQSVVKALQVLEAVADLQPIGVGELSRRLSLPKSTVQRCLVTLGDADWIRPSPKVQGSWVLSVHALTLGRTAELTLIEAAQGPMRRLRDQLNETIHLSVPNDDRHGVIVERFDCAQALRTYQPIGATSPLHATAAGRAMLALLPSERLEASIAAGLEAQTSETIVDPLVLRSVLEEARKRRYSVNIRQNVNNVCAVAAAVVDERLQPVAGISISMPDSRFVEDEVPRWGMLVRDAADEVSRNMLGARATSTGSTYAP